MSTWVINTNSNICHIYDYQKHPTQLHLIQEIQHPENRGRNQDLVTDGPGHYQSRLGNHGAYSDTTTPKEHAIEKFANEIAQILNQGNKDHKYDKLIIICEPHMNGLLSKHLSEPVHKLIVNNIKKNMIYLKQVELLDFLKENTRYPDEKR